MKYTLPTDSAERKNYPLADGPLSYFPAAIAGVAHVCKLGNDKHNPGEPLHHARGKSGDHANCIMRHLMDVNDLRAAIERHPMPYGVGDTRPAALLREVNQLAWRALALAQELHETYGDAPLAPGARLPEAPAPTKPSWARCTEESDPIYGRRCNKTQGHEGAHMDVAGYEWRPVAPAPLVDYTHEMPLIDATDGTPLSPLNGPAGADWRAR